MVKGQQTVRVVGLAIVLVVAGMLVVPRLTAKGGSARADRASVVRHFAKLPLAFVPNFGQLDPSVRMAAQGKGFGVSVSPTEAVLSLRGGDGVSVLRLSAVGGNPDAVVTGDAGSPEPSTTWSGRTRRGGAPTSPPTARPGCGACTRASTSPTTATRDS